jgi:retron-type reverse transcriptase
MSILFPKVYRDVFEKCGAYPCQSAYASTILLSIGTEVAGGGIMRAAERIKFSHTFEEMISVVNLLEAWKEFVKGKRGRADVRVFALNLMDNINELHEDLALGRYRHGGYHSFNISDPKPRIIHKAAVRDRLVHHAMYKLLYPFFDKKFIFDSFSCRKDKGNHAAINRFRALTRRASKNNMHTCRVLKCDIRKFFASVDQKILEGLLRRDIPDGRIIGLAKEIISSFNSHRIGVGLPLGNLTSQLFANIYLNELDRFVKYDLHFSRYIRYADDFVFLSPYKNELLAILPIVSDFLNNELNLELHPDKIITKTLASGIDFLGWVHFPDHRVLRKKTERRMFRRIALNPDTATVASYLGLLKYGNTQRIRTRISEILRNRERDILSFDARDDIY